MSRSSFERRMVTISTFAGLAGVIISLASTFISHQEKPKQLELPARIETLTKSLNSAAETIGQIELEIKQRRDLVQQLEKDAATASALSALNKEQMEAVGQVLRSEIKSDERQNFWGAQLLAFFYAALGVGLSEGYRFILRWRARRRLAAVE
jgi:uncharacterized membrane protein YdfJ with MMPL/SSD domain